MEKTIKDTINLNYLESTFGDNKVIINKILQSFMDNTPSLLLNLANCFINNDWEQTRMIAHKMKTSYNTIGAKNTGELLAIIEIETNENNKSNISELIELVRTFSESIFIEVDTELNK